MRLPHRHRQHAAPLVIAWLFVLAATACVDDPFPEPDPFDDSSGADLDGGQEDDDATSDYAADGALISASAGSPEGWVTVVGLAGAVADEFNGVRLTSAVEAISVPLGLRGDFAARLLAADGTGIEVVAIGPDGESQPIIVTAGVLEDGPVGDGIFGAGDVTAPVDGVATITGFGYALAAGDRIVAGNIDSPAGASVLVEGGMFELSIPATSDDRIDLFLVAPGSPSGRTDVETVIVP